MEAKSLRHAVLVIACGTVVVAGALLFLVVPVFTEEFRPAIELGLILLPGVALLGVGQILSETIVGRGKPIYSVYSALIVTPLTVALYLVLVPSLGAEGAALVKSASFTLSFALGVFFYRRVTGSVALSLFVPTATSCVTCAPSRRRSGHGLPGCVAGASPGADGTLARDARTTQPRTRRPRRPGRHGHPPPARAAQPAGRRSSRRRRPG